MPPGPTAATITVKEALDLLDASFPGLTSGIAEDRYALWLGSGISLGRVEGLRRLIQRVLDHLQRRVTIGDAGCRFRRALDEVFALANLDVATRTAIDVERPIADWLPLPALIETLMGNYARFLNIMVAEEEADYLLWEAVNVPETYANPATEPDTEHLCLAVLVMEGVASDLPSANWDGLIERALDEIAGAHPTALVVCVEANDLRAQQRQSRLYKFHGCAVRARNDEARYRHRLVGRQSQINGWVAFPDNAPMVNRLIDIAISKPTLMLGLSVQDVNIQAVFAEAQVRMPWPWPSDPPAYAFSEDALGFDQRILLQNVYRAAYTPATRDEINASALIRAYAKALLSALTLHIVCAKVVRLADRAATSLPPPDRAVIASGVKFLRDAVAQAANPNTVVFSRAAIAQASRIMAMFYEGNATASNLPYRSVTSRAIQHIDNDPAILAAGLGGFAIAVSLLGLGALRNLWTITVADPADLASGAMRIVSRTSNTKLFIAANSQAAMRLLLNGHLADTDDAIMIQSSEILPPMARSPRPRRRRTGGPGVREASVAELLAEATNGNELFQRFREELSI